MSYDKSFEKTWRTKSPSCFYCYYYRPSEHKKVLGYCLKHGVPLLLDWAMICQNYTLGLDPRNIRALTVADYISLNPSQVADLKAITSLPTVTIGSQPSSLFLHDRKTYKPARFDSNASGNIVAAVSGKVIKVHAYNIQAQGTVTVNFKDGSGGSEVGMEWKLQDREGAVVSFVPAPACWLKTSVNTALYVSLSASVKTVISMVYSDDDAT